MSVRPIGVDRLRNHATIHGRKMTYAEYNRLPEQPGLELIDGTIVKEPAPTYNHQSCSSELILILGTYVKARGLGEVLHAPFDVILSEDVVFQPDLLFVQQSRLHLIRQKGLFGAPDLAIEILSPGTRRIDEGRKKELYLEHGCRELWIVDTDAKTVARHISGGSDWDVTVFNHHERLKSYVIYGLQVPLSEAFKSRI